MKICLLSDTHSYIDDVIIDHSKDCDEIWHAGDFGSQDVIDRLIQTGKTFRGVYGNIDGQNIRSQFGEQIVFTCEGVKVMMRHLGGAPPKYNPETRKQLKLQQPTLFISGHSHILKIMYDETHSCLHMNPGAAGQQGWHKVRTMIRFKIEGKEMKDCEVIELGKRGKF